METRRPIAFGVLLLGLVVVAATAGMYAETTGPTFGGDAGGGADTGDGNDRTGLPPWVLSNFYVILMAATVLFLAASAAAVLWLKGWEGLAMIRRFVVENAIAGVAALALFVLGRAAIVHFSDGRAVLPESGQEAAGGSPGANGAEAAGSGGESIPTVWILLSVLVLMGILMYLMFQRGNDSTAAGASAGTGRSPPPEPATDSVESAVRIDDVPTSNAVYRAWREMATRAVDASERTATASDVARAALQAGFDREAVRTLTDLFEEVRYGGRPVTAERERKANAALEALEPSEEADA